MPLDQALLPPGRDYSGRDGTIAFWEAKGAPRHVAEGIADRVGAESSFNPTVPGDSGTSIGYYQHHADRKARLMQQPGWQSPAVQHQFAYGEVTGGDPIATAHWKEILAAPDRASAAKLWDRYFERSAAGVASPSGGHRMGGRFGGMGPRLAGDNAGEADEASQLRARFDQLARALRPAETAPVAVAPMPAQPAVAPLAMPNTLRLSPTPIPESPDLRNLYRTQLARVLGNGGVVR